MGVWRFQDLGLGFRRVRVWNLGFEVGALRLEIGFMEGVSNLRFRFRFRVLGFRVWDLGFRVWNLGFRFRVREFLGFRF